MFFNNNDVFGCNLSSVNPMKCVSINNQECKTRPEFVNVNSDEPVFLFVLVFKQVNAVVVAIISMIHMRNCVFLILLKILIRKYLF